MFAGLREEVSSRECNFQCMGSHPLDAFHPLVHRWFDEELGEPSRPQLQGWPAIASGDDTLIHAPTGTGKTLTAFL